MDVGTPSRQSAFSRVKHESETKPEGMLAELKPMPHVPTTLPGAGIQNRIPIPTYYPPEQLLQMFQPFNNGQYLPPEFFGRPAQMSAQGAPSTSMEQPVMAKDPALKQIRQQHEDRDSGNESTGMSPVSSFSSRSPSNSSRSNSFSMSTILRPADLASAANAVAAAVTASTAPHLPPIQQTSLGLGSSLPPLMPKPNGAQSVLPMGPLNPAMFAQSPHGLPSYPGMPMPPNALINSQLMGQLRQFEQFRRLSQNPQYDPMMSGPFRETCDVCGDNASGYHYGVMSCEGCKGFFRRAVQRACVFKCNRDGNCQSRIDRVNRNRCQACRLQQCLDKGMAKESVRLDRSRKSKKNDEDIKQQLEDLKEIMTSTNEITAAFKAAFPEDATVKSIQDIAMRCALFIGNLKLFNELEKDQQTMIVQKSLRGNAVLRAALSRDSCHSIELDRDLVGKIATGIEIARDTYDDLAVLTAVYMASYSEDVELQDTLSRCLRSQLKRRLPNEEHLFCELMSKLPLLQ